MTERRRKAPKVPCPHCGEWQSTVLPMHVDTPHPHGYPRMRQCDACHHEFRTIEILADPQYLEVQSA